MFGAWARYWKPVGLLVAAAVGPVSGAAGQGAPAKTTVASQVLVMGEPGLQYSISPKGQHLAAVVLRGSRQVMVHDGVDGPRFDEILVVPGISGAGGKVVWSEDGSRYAYFGRVGQEYVVLVDGKEAARGPWSVDLASQGLSPVYQLGFAPGDKHWYLVVHTKTSGRDNYQLVIDGKPGPMTQGDIPIAWSPDGAHHAYVATIFPISAPRQSQLLIVDGKPAPYQAGEPQFTADGLHLFTKRMVAGGATEILADGAPFIRTAGDVRLHIAPSGPGVLGVVTLPFQNSVRTAFLTLGNRRVAGSDCQGGINGVYLSTDAKHWAIRCQAGPSAYWVMADGKKGQEYAGGLSNVVFTADGRPVYQANTNGKNFLIIGDQESDGYETILGDQRRMRADPQVTNPSPAPAVVSGNTVGYLARAATGNNFVAIVNGKSYPVINASHLSLSPDGSRFALLTGHPYQSATVDGVAHAAMPVDPAWGNIGYQGTFQWSADSKHVAWLATTQSSPGIAIDGKFVASTGGAPRFLKFTVDGRHLVWLVRSQPGHLVFVDGVKVLELAWSGALENEADVYWSFNADGTVVLVAQDEGAMKRFTITPGSDTSVETVLAKAVTPR